MSKYKFEYVCHRESWLWTCPNVTLNMFVNGKVNFRHDEIWLWVYLSKEKLILNMFKYDFESCRNMTLSIFVKGKVDIKYVQIWLWVCLLKAKLKVDFKHVEI
jgi:hypothetical protein